jgi:hypothetical protein
MEKETFFFSFLKIDFFKKYAVCRPNRKTVKYTIAESIFLTAALPAAPCWI